MGHFNQRITSLSPEKRALLMLRLKQKGGAASTEIHIPRRKNPNSYPLSFAQQRMWFHDQLAAGSALNNIPLAIRASGDLDILAFKSALLEIMRRHEVLRANFITENGRPQQVIAPEANLSLTLIDLEEMPSTRGEKMAISLAEEVALKSFDLSHGPLLRLAVIRITSHDYIIVITVHHIIADAWSTGVLMKELVLLYDAFVAGKALTLPELSIQYADYAAWQQERLTGQAQASKLNYWQEKLADSPALLDLPTDWPRPKQLRFEGAHEPFQFSPELTAAVEKLSHSLEATPFMVLLAAWQLLLARYSGQFDICVGTPVANREPHQTQELIGFFVNVLVMRTQLKGDSTFLEVLQQVKQRALEAYARQEVPFEKIVETLNLSRDPGYNPLFQVLFNFQNKTTAPLEVAGIKFKPLFIETGTVKFDLVLSIESGGTVYSGVWGYNQSLFRASTAKRMIRHYLYLLERLVKAPDQPVSNFSLVTPAEWQQVVVNWNQTRRNFSDARHAGIHQLFAEQAARTPEAPALIFTSRSHNFRTLKKLTYQELNQRANCLANYLRQQGVKPEALVGLYLEKSPEMIIGLLGILKAGGAFVPLDPDYPQERIHFILKDADIKLVLTQQTLAIHLEGSDCQTLCLDSEWEKIAQAGPASAFAALNPQQLAYLIYTSGSTGTPKGVMIQQAALVNHARAMQEKFQLKQNDRLLQFISLSFDAAAEEIYPPLISGAALVLVQRPAELTGSDLVKLTEEQEISILHLPAAFWHNWMDYLIQANIRLPNSIRSFLVGGEAPSVEKVAQLKNFSKNSIDFMNAYGPTEGTITCSLYKMSAEQVMEGAPLPIGKPLSNTQIYILDPFLNPVPVGVSGEIYLGGIGLARGYLNRPELTAEKFIPNRFSEIPGARLYKTGDRACYLPDGNVLFGGRVDFQVKIRGYRIEPGEIENVIQQTGKVKQVAVLAREDLPGHKRLVAYLVPKSAEAFQIEELNEFLKAQLPDFMLPSAVMILDEMPLTVHGKIDRKALPPPETSTVRARQEFVPPRDEVDAFLVKLWQEILQVEPIGIHDNFFESGGNSILGATLVNRLQAGLGEYVYLILIFDAPTIAEMADYLKQDYPQGIAKILQQYASEPPDEPDPVSHQVERINPAKLDQLRQLIVTLPPRKISVPEPKNPSAVFILSAPRSGSTLLRVILGGNPRLFAPPELQLLNYNTLADQQTAFSNERDAFWLDGSVRAIMALKDCDAESARQQMEHFREQKLTVKQFYRVLQEWLGERIFVDKTPNYSLDLATLQRAEEDFEKPRYIHLIRHPYAVIPSFEKAKLHVFYPPFFKASQPFKARELAELIWIISHQNILHFLNNIPAERQRRVYYEDLVRRPSAVVTDICDFLQLDFHPDMLKPQQDPHKKMTDGIHPLAKMLGDVRFHEHQGIDAMAADRWKKHLKHDYLGEITWDLAERLGYQRSRPSKKFDKPAATKALSSIKPIPRTGDLPLSFGQKRLWFLEQMAPGSPAYNIPLAIQIQGKLNPEVFEQSLNEIIRRHEVLRTNIQTIDGKPVLKIAPERMLKIKLIDLTSQSPHLQAERAQEEAVAESKQPFDIATDLLLRVKILKFNETDYLLLLTLHHIAADGWSGVVLVKELIAFYQALWKDQKPAVPDLPIQYLDYAAWQQERLQGEILSTQRAYWREQLKNLPAGLDLPTDRPRPAEISTNGATHSFHFTPELSQAVKTLCQQEGATEFMTLLAAFQCLLFRYSGQNDICVGTPVANRSRVEFETLIGFFVNTLVIRTIFTDKMSFRKLLKQVRRTTIAAFNHQDIPFEMLVDEIQPDRNMSQTPLFQVMFAYQNISLPTLELPDLTIQPFASQGITAKFELTLSMREQEGILGGVLEYNSDLFEATTIERLVGHFICLMNSITDNPDQPVTFLSILPEIERFLQQEAWNDTGAEYPARACLHELFEEQVRQTPHAVAVVDQEKTLSFEELNGRANQLAHSLQKQGIAPDVLVGLFVERSVEMIIGLLGILKAGGAYVPIDPTYPRERIQYILNDAQVAVVVTQEALVAELPSAETTVICLDRDWPDIAGESAHNPKNTAATENLAYCVFTSGSTGKPKGVLIQHQSVLNLMQELTQQIYAKLPARPLRISLNAPLMFDASVQQIVMLVQGHALYILPHAVRGDGTALLQFIQRAKLDVLDCVPSQLKLLLAAGLLTTEGWQPRAILPGGEAIEEATWEKIASAAEIEFFNMYGPTECTVDSTIAHVQPARLKPTIGRAINNVRLYVLDACLQAVPIGVYGELFIAGAGLARGYLNRPDLTAEKFIPDPFCRTSGCRMYRTGDRVRFSANGNLEFAGRVDYQVKVRGFRIELGEIEATLQQHPALGTALVVVREDQSGSKRLVAYYTLATNVTPTISELRAFLANQLPDYMIPAYFCKLDTLPLTPNGKVDRRALPVPELSRAELSQAYVAPRNEVEDKLMRIWKQVLGLAQVGVFDNFFELGGDSILSIQVISKANQAGIQLNPKQLFQHPTIAGLAEVAGTGARIQAEQGLLSGSLPLTPIQNHFFEQDLPDPNHWNQALLFQVNQPLELALLKKVVQALVRQHDALRLRFKVEAGEIFQYYQNADEEISVIEIDLSDVTPATLNKTIATQATEFQQSLNINCGPLMSVVYFFLGHNQPGRLLIIVHHLAIDAVSWQILLADFQMAFEQSRRNEAIQLPPKTTSYRQWGQHLHQYAASAELKQEVNFWRRFTHLSISPLPVDYKHGVNDETKIRNILVALEPAETEALLSEVSATYGTDVNDLLLTALVLAFAQWTDEQCLFIHLEGHGREPIFDDIDLSRTVGWFTTLYPIFLDLSNHSEIGEALKTIKEQLRRVPQRGIGFGVLRYLCPEPIQQQMRAIPSPQIGFNYLGQVDQALPENSIFALAAESAGPTHNPRGKRLHLIDINAHISEGQLKLSWTYSAAVHQRKTIKMLAQSHLEVLCQILAHCQTLEKGGYTPSDFPEADLSQQELDQLVEEIEGI